METLKKIINADDFGISPGVNKAVITAFEQGCLNSASIMMNVAYTDEAIKYARDNPALMTGIHLNISNQKNQKPLSDPRHIPLLVDKGGNLKHGFVVLFLLSLFKTKELKKQAEIEMHQQIEAAQNLGINIAHLDSHRHVHMIPALFTVVKKLQEEYKIPRIRIVNENAFKTFFNIWNPRCFFNGGAIKYGILKTFYYLNRTKSDTYFYSIVYTTRLFGRNVSRIRVPKKYKAIEIGIHPSCIAEDKKVNSPAFSDYLLYSDDRQKEFETIANKELLNKISY